MWHLANSPFQVVNRFDHQRSFVPIKLNRPYKAYGQIPLRVLMARRKLQG